MTSTSKISSSNSSTVNISPHCHLDPVSYVKGTHLLALENAVLVHPRSRLFTDAGPITIREGSIISEKCTIGTLSGSDPTLLHRGLQSSSSKSMLPAGSATESKLSSLSQSVAQEGESSAQTGPAITIGRSVYVHPNVNIQPPSTIANFVILESGVTIQPGCTINAHSKICAGVDLPPDTIVPSWTVVYGIDGRLRRRRHKDASEDSRLEGMSRERITAINLLRSSAIVSKLANSSSTSTSRDKRQSVLLGDGFKPS